MEEKLQAFPPLQVAWACEQLAHDAATSTTAAISGIVSDRSQITGADDNSVRNTKWLGSLSHIYRSLILASAGKNRTDNTAFSDLLGAMVEIYRDRLEIHAGGGSVDISQVLAQLRPTEQEQATEFHVSHGQS